MTDAITVTAQRLRDAASSRTPCSPVRDVLGSTDVETAYQVQLVNLKEQERAGRRVIGRKIGLTSEAVQKQLGVDQPDFGSLLDDMVVGADGHVPMSRLLQPKAEAEVAFVLAQDITETITDPADLRPMISHAVAAIEIVDSRVAGWDITIVDTVADNASSAMFALAPNTVALPDDLTAVTMSLTVNGEERSTGTGRACLGDPLAAMMWLANMSIAMGNPLRAGEVILSGALGPMVAVSAGDRVQATVSEIGTVDIMFG